MRDFAERQLSKHLTNEEAKIFSRSCVSQRDIQRVFTFIEWFKAMYDEIKPYGDNANYENRAVLVSLGLVYYMRLNDTFRKEYQEFMESNEFGASKISFMTAYMDELEFFIKKVELPKGIAHTLALKENLFATIICTVTQTPLIIVGAPGSSKTLSFNQAIANLKGQESKMEFFRNTKFFRSLDPHHYQCSRRTTSNEIQIVFSRAINRQRSHREFNLHINCVVFMDEAGLPEEHHESLKVLHYHLDSPEVSFVAISNHVLDAAKTNRAISLFRPEASISDLKTLAKGCLCLNPEKALSLMDENNVMKLCHPFSKFMKNDNFFKFFGLRDFIQFITYLQRMRDIGSSWTPQMVVKAVERNFNGSNDFESICQGFLEALYSDSNSADNQRLILEVLQESLADRPQVAEHLEENDVRYKLLIDSSEDDSLIRLLFKYNILKKDTTHVFVGSDFSEDGQLQKINTIAAIRHSAMQGHTVIMSQTDDIHESFYDLFNQRFRCIDDPERGSRRYYTNIAIGSHSKPSRVDPNFQCVVVLKRSEVDHTPAPFLNRFEKYQISYSSLFQKIKQSFPSNLAPVIQSAKEKVCSGI